MGEVTQEAAAAAGGGGAEDEGLWGEDEYGRYRIDDHVWTMNEIRDHPLFMEDVPSDISDNPYLLALQNIVYDDQSPEDLAEHFRKLGNEAFRTANNRIANQNALLCYTKGLEMECSDKALNSQLHSNRAALSLRVEQYDKAVDDSRKAIELDPSNLKAYFRGAKASEALGLTGQALRFCAAALRQRPEEQDFLKLQASLSKRLEREERDRQRLRRVDAKEVSDRQAVDSAVSALLTSRGARLGPLLFDASMYAKGAPPRPKLTEDGAIEWPLLLLYDETSQSDFVETFDERCCLSEQLQMMFPPDRPVEWDEEGKYIWDRLVAYMEYYPEEGRETEMFLVDTGAPLEAALQDRCLPPCLGIHIHVRASGALASFCRTHNLSPP